MLKPPSLADLICRIEADPDLSSSKRRNLASSVRMFAKVLELDLAHDRAAIRPYRDKLATFEPARAAMSRKALVEHPLRLPLRARAIRLPGTSPASRRPRC